MSDKIMVTLWETDKKIEFDFIFEQEKDLFWEKRKKYYDSYELFVDGLFNTLKTFKEIRVSSSGKWCGKNSRDELCYITLPIIDYDKYLTAIKYLEFRKE